MLRINIAALTWTSDRYCYLDKLFCGVAYIVSENPVSHVVEIVDGMRFRDYVSPYFSCDLPFPSVDLTGLRKTTFMMGTSTTCEGDGAAIEDMVATHVFFPIRSASELKNFKAAERFVMADDDVKYGFYGRQHL